MWECGMGGHIIGDRWQVHLLWGVFDWGSSIASTLDQELEASSSRQFGCQVAFWFMISCVHFHPIFLQTLYYIYIYLTYLSCVAHAFPYMQKVKPCIVPPGPLVPRWWWPPRKFPRFTSIDPKKMTPWSVSIRNNILEAA